MGLFGKSKEDKERKEVKKNIDRMMKDYSKGKIDDNEYIIVKQSDILAIVE